MVLTNLFQRKGETASHNILLPYMPTRQRAVRLLHEACKKHRYGWPSAIRREQTAAAAYHTRQQSGVGAGQSGGCLPPKVGGKL